MEGTLFPNRPPFPVPQTKLTIKQPNPRLKFSTCSTLLLPLQQQLSQQQQRHEAATSSASFPIDSVLQHLLHISKSKPRTIKTAPTKGSPFTASLISTENGEFQEPLLASSITIPVIGDYREEHHFRSDNDDGSLDFLPVNCKLLLNSIIQHPISSLNKFLDSIKFELLEVDLMSLLKGLDVLENWPGV